MKNISKLILAVAIVVAVNFAAYAQPGSTTGGFDDEPQDVSVDGGIVLLVIAGVAYGYKKLKAINLNPVYKQNGIVVDCIGITRDINAVKKKEIERENYAQKLDEFAFKTSHELRRPLANILGIVPLLKEEKNSDQFTLLLEALNMSAKELDLEVKAMNESFNKK
jgi:signal transduction histidine kinase